MVVKENGEGVGDFVNKGEMGIGETRMGHLRRVLRGWQKSLRIAARHSAHICGEGDSCRGYR